MHVSAEQPAAALPPGSFSPPPCTQSCENVAALFSFFFFKRTGRKFCMVCLCFRGVVLRRWRRVSPLHLLRGSFQIPRSLYPASDFTLCSPESSANKQKAALLSLHSHQTKHSSLDFCCRNPLPPLVPSPERGFEPEPAGPTLYPPPFFPPGRRAEAFWGRGLQVVRDDLHGWQPRGRSPAHPAPREVPGGAALRGKGRGGAARQPQANILSYFVIFCHILSPESELSVRAPCSSSKKVGWLRAGFVPAR